MPPSPKSAPPPVWQMPAGFHDHAPPLVKGKLYFVATIVDIDGRPTNSVIQSVDIQHAQETAVYITPAGSFLRDDLHVAGSVAYGLEKDGRSLFAIDLLAGKLLWAFPTQKTTAEENVTDPVFADGLVFLGVGSRYYAIDEGGTPAWSYQVPDTPWILSNAAVRDHSVVFYGLYFQGSLTCCLDAQSGREKWTQRSGAAAAGPPAIGDGVVALALESNMITAFDLASGAPLWSRDVANVDPGVSAPGPAVADEVVYYGSGAGTLSALDATRGDLLWTFEAGYPCTDLIVQDGAAYMGTGRSATLTFQVLAIDLASRGEEVVRYQAKEATALSRLTVDTGVVYFFQQGLQDYLYAVNLGGILHEFFIESELMVEDYDTTSGAVPETTSFRTHVVMVDQNKVPRSFQAVKIWSNQPVTITVDGTSYDIDSDHPAWVDADGAGNLSIVADAATTSTPALSLWGNFMFPAETVVVYPDQEVVARLSTVQGADLDPAIARDYQGQPILLSAYQAPEQREGVAQVIRNTIGRQQGEVLLSAAPSGQRQTRYLAYPKSMPAAVYEPTGGAKPRPLTAGEFSSWSLEMDDSSVHFRPIASAALAALRRPAPGDIFHDFKAFVENVVHGAEKVGQAAWNFAEGAAEVIVHTAENAYQFVIDSVEDAMQVVVGILKRVITDIKAVVQWLSYVFDWKAFVATHDEIEQFLQQGTQALKDWVDGEAANGFADIKALFRQLDDQVTTAFDAAIAKLGGTSWESVRRGRTDPILYYGAGGAKSYVKSQWLPSKVKQGAQAALVATAGPGENPIVEAAEAFFNAAKETLETDFPQLAVDAEAILKNFARLFTDPSQFVKSELSAVLAMIRDVVVTVLDFSEALLEAAMKLLQTLFDLIYQELKKPISIPVVSDLYRALTGNPLSALDLCALIVAVPTTIVARALHAAETRGTFSPQWAEIAYTFAFFAYSGIDLIQDQMNLILLSLLLAAFHWILCLFGLGGPWRTPQQAVEDRFFACFCFLPVIWRLWVALVPEVQSSALPVVFGIYGVAFIVLSGVYAFLWPGVYWDDSLVLIENLARALGMGVKAGDELFGEFVVGVVELLSNDTSAVLSALNTWLNKQEETADWPPARASEAAVG